MVCIKGSYPYYETEQYKLLELPIKNNFVFGILLENNINDIIIPNESFLSQIDFLKETELNIQIPKININTILISNNILHLLNTKLSNEKQIIQQVKLLIHFNNITNLNVNSNNETDFIANHSFIYYIKHKTTGLIICNGIYKL